MAKKKERFIVSNRIKTPDGTILISRHVHDYVGHEDKITKSHYAADGGKDYCKRVADARFGYEELSVYSDENFELVRHVFEWGSRGADGKQPLQWVTLRNMTDEHIKNVLLTQHQIASGIADLFQKELTYRMKKKIVILPRVEE